MDNNLPQPPFYAVSVCIFKTPKDAFSLTLGKPYRYNAHHKATLRGCGDRLARIWLPRLSLNIL